MAPPPPAFHQGPVVGMSRPQPAHAQYRQQQTPYAAPAPTPDYRTYQPQRPRNNTYNSDDSDTEDEHEGTEEEDASQQHADQHAPMLSSLPAAHHSLAYERSGRSAEPAPYRTTHATPTQPQSQPPRKTPQVTATKSMVDPPVSSARPIPVPRSATQHDFAGTAMPGSSPSSTSRMSYYASAANSGYGAPVGSYGSGSDRGSASDRGAKHRPGVHEEWRTSAATSDAPALSSSPSSANPKRWLPPRGASPPSNASPLPRKTSAETLRSSAPAPSSSPTTSTLQHKPSAMGLRKDGHTHAPSLDPVPELGRAPRKDKIWHPPASEYEREHEEAAAARRALEPLGGLRIPHNKPSAINVGTPTRTSRPGSSASLYPGSPATYSPGGAPSSPAIPRPGSSGMSREPMYPSSGYASSGTVFPPDRLTDSPPGSPQLFPRPLDPPSASRSMPKPRGRAAAELASVKRDLDDDAEEWVRVLRAEHVERFEAQKKLAELELEAKLLDIAKKEVAALVNGGQSKEEIEDARVRAREDFSQQMETLAAIQDGQLRNAIASEEIRREGGGGSSSAANVDIWEENLRAEQEIIMEQIARDRRASVNAESPLQESSSSRRASNAPAPAPTAPESNSLHERNAERRASGLQRQREEVEARERQIEQEKEVARQRDAAVRDAQERRRKEELDAERARDREREQRDRERERERQRQVAKEHEARPPSPNPMYTAPRHPLSRKARVESGSEGDNDDHETDGRDDSDDHDTEEEDENVENSEAPDESSSEEESEPSPRSRTADVGSALNSPSPAARASRPPRHTTLPDPPRTGSSRQPSRTSSDAPPTPAPAQSAGTPSARPPAPSRQGSAAIDIPVAKPQMPGEPPPARPRPPRYDSFTVDSPTEKEVDPEVGTPLTQAREHRPYSQSFTGERISVRRPSNATTPATQSPAPVPAPVPPASSQSQADAEAASQRERQKRLEEMQQRKRDEEHTRDVERQRLDEKKRQEDEHNRNVERQRQEEQKRRDEEQKRREEEARQKRLAEDRLRREEQRREEQRREEQRLRDLDAARERLEAENRAKRELEREREREREQQRLEAEARERLRRAQEADRQKRDEDRAKREQEAEFQRRADEAKFRYQERRRQEEDEKQRERWRRQGSAGSFSGADTSSFPGSPPPFSGASSSSFSSFPNSPSTNGQLPASVAVPAWERYDKGWSNLPDKANQGALRWMDLPWPLANVPANADVITNKLIADFLLSPHVNQSKSTKERLREALLRWHPDRFDSRWLPKCAESDKEEIKKGVGNVVRCLNEMMSVQGAFGS